MKNCSYYKKCLKVLEEINKKFPKYSVGKVLVTALDGYDLWSISDKEVLFALEKYAAELEFDIPHEDSELYTIIQDGLRLDRLFDNDDDDENGY